MQSFLCGTLRLKYLSKNYLKRKFLYSVKFRHQLYFVLLKHEIDISIDAKSVSININFAKDSLQQKFKDW